MPDLTASEKVEMLYALHSEMYEGALALSALMLLLVGKGIITNEEINRAEEEIGEDPRMKIAFYKIQEMGELANKLKEIEKTENSGVDAGV